MPPETRIIIRISRGRSELKSRRMQIYSTPKRAAWEIVRLAETKRSRAPIHGQMRGSRVYFPCRQGFIPLADNVPIKRRSLAIFNVF